MYEVHFLNVEFFFQKGYELISQGDIRGFGYLLLGLLDSFLETIGPISLAVSVLCIAGTIYCAVRIGQIRRAEAALLKPAPAAGMSREFLNSKWQKVVEHISSEKENDWRLAILEADIMLDEMMEAQGYRHDTLSEKLKAVEKSDFTTVDLAWEAHKVRNRIAHEGSSFALSHREAKRIIGLYEKVFKEFRYI